MMSEQKENREFALGLKHPEPPEFAIDVGRKPRIVNSIWHNAIPWWAAVWAVLANSPK